MIGNLYLNAKYNQDAKLGLAAQLANAKRVSDGRDRQGQVIREQIRANAQMEIARMQAEARQREIETRQQMMREQLMAEGKLQPVKSIGPGGRRTEYRPR